MIRFFDILFSALAILILLPFMIPIMIALKLTGEHYIFYQQPRIGKGGGIQSLEIRDYAEGFSEHGGWSSHPEK